MANYMTAREKELIVDYIEKQPIKIVKSYNFETRKVQYVKELRGESRKAGDEEFTRAYLLTKLVNELGYAIEDIEIERVYTAGRPHTNTSRIDIVVEDRKKDCFLFIEVKSPGEYTTMDKNEVIKEQLFKVAGMQENDTIPHKVKYLLLYTVSFTENTVVDESTIIDFEAFPTYNKWEKVLDYLTDIPGNYGIAKKIPFVKGSKKDLEIEFTSQKLDYLQKDLHNVLWGGGGTDDNDVFSSLTNLILAKIQDEDEKRKGDEYDFQTKSFEKIEKLYERINALYRRALKEKLNVNDKAQLEKSYVVDTNKFSMAKVKYTVQSLEKYSLVDGKNSVSGKDILGNFFEGIIRTGFKQTKGQFFTPINIVKFMIWALQTDKLAIHKINSNREIPFMIDPSAGSGTFLIEYMKFITKNIKYRFKEKLDTSRAVEDKYEEWFKPDHRENKWAREYIYGAELNFNLGTSAKVNMILHGGEAPNIFVGTQKGDGLLPFNEYRKLVAPNILNKEFDDPFYPKKVNGQFDVIITNPPFSTSLDNDTKSKLVKSFMFDEKKNTENLFIERYYQLLREHGRLAVVLPESVFDTTENKYIRLFIYKYFNVKAIVSLPQITFEPFTSTKTSILFAQKKSQNEIEKWNDAWKKYSQEYQYLKTRVNNLIEVYSNNKDKSKLSSIKDLSIAQEKEIILRYTNNFSKDIDKELTMEELLENFKTKIEEINEFDKDTVKDFGYVNTWWVFEKVSKELDYDIFMAEVDNIGYKRTKRGEKLQPNDLFRINENGTVLVDDGNKETVLDFIRDINWGN